MRCWIDRIVSIHRRQFEVQVPRVIITRVVTDEAEFCPGIHALADFHAKVEQMEVPGTPAIAVVDPATVSGRRVVGELDDSRSGRDREYAGRDTPTRRAI